MSCFPRAPNPLVQKQLDCSYVYPKDLTQHDYQPTLNLFDSSLYELQTQGLANLHHFLNQKSLSFFEDPSVHQKLIQLFDTTTFKSTKISILQFYYRLIRVEQFPIFEAPFANNLVDFFSTTFYGTIEYPEVRLCTFLIMNYFLKYDTDYSINVLRTEKYAQDLLERLQPYQQHLAEKGVPMGENPRMDPVNIILRFAGKFLYYDTTGPIIENSISEIMTLKEAAEYHEGICDFLQSILNVPELKQTFCSPEIYEFIYNTDLTISCRLLSKMSELEDDYLSPLLLQGFLDRELLPHQSDLFKDPCFWNFLENIAKMQDDVFVLKLVHSPLLCSIPIFSLSLRQQLSIYRIFIFALMRSNMEILEAVVAYTKQTKGDIQLLSLIEACAHFTEPLDNKRIVFSLNFVAQMTVKSGLLDLIEEFQQHQEELIDIAEGVLANSKRPEYLGSAAELLEFLKQQI